METVFYTNKGPTRPENQDGVYLNGSVYTSLENPEQTFLEHADGLFAVVDGMGGPSGGKLAAQIVLENLDEISGEPQCHALDLALNRIQYILHENGQGINAHMGAALAGIWVQGQKAIAFNCGDCRVYQYKDNSLQKLTHDHSIVQDLFDSGDLDENQMRLYPRRNILTSALIADMPDPDIFCRAILYKPGDKFLICSDGLWEALDKKELTEAMNQPAPLAAMNMVRQAWKAAAQDNFSFVIIN